MARLMNALQLALGSVGSGIQGYAQAKSLREEQERQAKLFKQQQDMNAENNQFRLAELMTQGFEQGPVGPALNAASANAAPSTGGMPMPPAAAQAALASASAEARSPRTITIGGQTLTLRETPSERAERLSSALRTETKQDTDKKAAAEETRVTKLIADAQKGGAKSAAALRLGYENAAAYKAIFDDPSGGLSAAKQDAKAEDLRTAEAYFNTPIQDPQERKNVATAFNRLRAAKPNASPQELMLDVYNATKASADLSNVRAQTRQRDSSGSSDLLAGIPILPATGGTSSSVDQNRYKSDAGYRAWVDSQNR
jgi:hypothetical protein